MKPVEHWNYYDAEDAVRAVAFAPSTANVSALLDAVYDALESIYDMREPTYIALEARLCLAANYLARAQARAACDVPCRIYSVYI